MNDLKVAMTIKRVIRKRRERGASEESINKYKESLLTIWETEPLRQFIRSL